MESLEFNTKSAETLSSIPKEFHSALSYLAYEMGHSAGYDEVLLYLDDLVGAIEEPIKAFEKRLFEKFQMDTINRE